MPRSLQCFLSFQTKILYALLRYSCSCLPHHLTRIDLVTLMTLSEVCIYTLKYTVSYVVWLEKKGSNISEKAINMVSFSCKTPLLRSLFNVSPLLSQRKCIIFSDANHITVSLHTNDGSFPKHVVKQSHFTWLSEYVAEYLQPVYELWIPSDPDSGSVELIGRIHYLTGNTGSLKVCIRHRYCIFWSVTVVNTLPAYSSCAHYRNKMYTQIN